MPIQVVCSQCGNQLSMPDHLAGKQANCPRCAAVMVVPEVEGRLATPIQAELADDPLGAAGEVSSPFAPSRSSPPPFPGAAMHAPPPIGRGSSLNEMGKDPTLRMLLPVGRSALAIAAGYAGLFAILFFPAPIAIVLGILALRDIRRHPEKHGMGRAIFGLVMGILFSLPCLVAMVAGLLDRQW